MVNLGDPTGDLDGSVLKLSQQIVPPLPPTGVRVRVVASSLNFADLLQAQVRRRSPELRALLRSFLPIIRAGPPGTTPDSRKPEGS